MHGHSNGQNIQHRKGRQEQLELFRDLPKEHHRRKWATDPTNPRALCVKEAKSSSVPKRTDDRDHRERPLARRRELRRDPL